MWLCLRPRGVVLSANRRVKKKLFSAKHVFLVFGSTAVKVFMAHSCLFTNADDESGHVVGLWVTWPLVGIASVLLCLFSGMCCVVV